MILISAILLISLFDLYYNHLMEDYTYKNPYVLSEEEIERRLKMQVKPDVYLPDEKKLYERVLKELKAGFTLIEKDMF